MRVLIRVWQMSRQRSDIMVNFGWVFSGGAYGRKEELRDGNIALCAEHIFVVGYHTRSIVDYGGNSLFQFGYFAVEFFFILSGFLLARSLERAYTAERFRLLPDTGRFMWRKIKSFLPFHLVAVVLMMIVIAAFDTSSFAARMESGWTGIFLLQSAVVWTTCEGLIVPEWYLSTMLIAILIIYPCARLLGRKIRRKVFVPVILIAGLGVVAVAVGFGINWSFSWNLSNDLRGFGEMCAGMLCFYLSRYLSGREFGEKTRTALASVETVCYVGAFAVMCLPFDIIGTIGIPLVIVLSAVAVTISFSGHGLSSAKLSEKICLKMGALSLPLYLLHPVVIEFASHTMTALPGWATVLLVFAVSIALTFAVYEIYAALKKHSVRRAARTEAAGGVAENLSAYDVSVAEKKQEDKDEAKEDK